MKNTFLRKTKHGAAILTLLIIIAGAFCAWWLVVRADHDMREDLLSQAHLVAGAVSIEHLQALTVTEADLDSPEYLRLKEQFAAVRAANPKCRFVYLMGRKADATVFFYADSEPAGSEDESPAGQVYDEISAEYLRAFDTKTAMAVGPVADRWGTWITALVPITDPKTGELLAVMGMDIDASEWKWDVAARAALPMGLMLVLLIGLVALLVGAGRTSASPRPVLWRLMPAMTVLLVMLFALGAMLLWHEQRMHLNEKTSLIGAEAIQDLQQTLEQQARGLAAAAQPIAMDARLRQALRSTKAEQLLSD